VKQCIAFVERQVAISFFERPETRILHLHARGIGTQELRGKLSGVIRKAPHHLVELRAIAAIICASKDVAMRTVGNVLMKARLCRPQRNKEIRILFWQFERRLGEKQYRALF
jgi:hypothetical protein